MRRHCETLDRESVGDTSAFDLRRKTMFQKLFTATCLLLTLILFGCSDALTATEPTAQPTQAVAQADESTATFEPTATYVLEPTDAPTATPTAAPPTETPAPDATDTPIPSPTNTPTPTATPAPLEFRDRESLDEENRSPFTGEVFESEEIANRRPIICKVSNSPAEYTRPQYGLNSADMVFEHLAEGVTRFSVLMHSQTPERLGPIRSARLIDTYLAEMYDAAFCFSGASIGVSGRLEGSNFRSRLLRSYYEGYFRDETLDVPFEHTMFTEPQLFWEIELEKRELNRAPRSVNQAAFSSEPPEGGEEAEYVSIQYRNWSFVEWEWDDEIGKWIRTVDDEVLTDKNTDEPISADNVLILFVPHFVDRSICDWQLEQIPEPNAHCLAGGLYPDFDGWGDAHLMRDGRHYVGRWESDGENTMLTYYDEDGNALPLQIGNTWVQVLPYSYQQENRMSFER